MDRDKKRRQNRRKEDYRGASFFNGEAAAKRHAAQNKREIASTKMEDAAKLLKATEQEQREEAVQEAKNFMEKAAAIEAEATWAFQKKEQIAARNEEFKKY